MPVWVAPIVPFSPFHKTHISMEDSIIQLIYVASGLISALSGIVVYVLGRIHLKGRAGAIEDNVSDVAQKLEQLQSQVVQHEVQIKTGIKVAEALSPEAQALVDAHKAKIDALSKDIEEKTATLNELKKVLPVVVAPKPQPTTPA